MTSIFLIFLSLIVLFGSCSSFSFPSRGQGWIKQSFDSQNLLSKRSSSSLSASDSSSSFVPFYPFFQPSSSSPLVVPSPSNTTDYSSRFYNERVILLSQEVNDNMAEKIIPQLLFLAKDDPTKDITLLINSPGGSISSGMAILDTMNSLPCDIATVCIGCAASMGAFLLAAGTKGKRRAMPNSFIMIHQPLGGASGSLPDVEIHTKEILFTRNIMNHYLSEFTGQSFEKIERDCDRDFYMTPEEAKDYGIVDEVVVTKLKKRRDIPYPSL